MAGQRGRSGGARRGAGRKPVPPSLRAIYGLPPAPSACASLSTVASDVSAPPAHLSQATKAWFSYVARTWAVDEHHVRLLVMACDAWELAEGAREALARDGLTVPMADGGMKAHPLLGVAAAARGQFSSLIAQLDLDAVAPKGGR